MVSQLCYSGSLAAWCYSQPEGQAAHSGGSPIGLKVREGQLVAAGSCTFGVRLGS